MFLFTIRCEMFRQQSMFFENKGLETQTLWNENKQVMIKAMELQIASFV